MSENCDLNSDDEVMLVVSGQIDAVRYLLSGNLNEVQFTHELSEEDEIKSNREQYNRLVSKFHLHGYGRMSKFFHLFAGRDESREITNLLEQIRELNTKYYELLEKKKYPVPEEKKFDIFNYDEKWVRYSSFLTSSNVAISSDDKIEAVTFFYREALDEYESTKFLAQVKCDMISFNADIRLSVLSREIDAIRKYYSDLVIAKERQRRANAYSDDTSKTEINH